MFKYSLGQEVWFLKNNQVCHSVIRSRQYIDNKNKAKYDSLTRDQQITHCFFGPEDIKYSLGELVLPENKVFPSKKDLLDSL